MNTSPGLVKFSFSLVCTVSYIFHYVSPSKMSEGASLVAQWLRICLPMQGTWVRALAREVPKCRGARVPQLLSLRSRARVPQLWSLHATTTEAQAPRARAPQQEKPLQ